MLQDQLTAILATFRRNVESVNELMRFDSLILDFAVQHLTSLQERLTTVHGLDNPRFDVEKTLTMMLNIRQNRSLENRIIKRC